MTRAGCVLDTSALLAWLWQEPGETQVDDALAAGNCHLSAVNLAELLAKLADEGMSTDEGQRLVQSLELRIVPLDAEDAELSAQMRPGTRSAGLSLGDRACLALAQRLGLAAITADRAWSSLNTSVTIVSIRPPPKP